MLNPLERTVLNLLTGLLLSVILLLTLSPFDFTTERIGHFSWKTTYRDAAENLLMTIPLGFLLRLRRRERAPPLLLLPELAFGLLLSLGVESAQLFLPTRASQYSDIVMNAAGCWIGALWAYAISQIRLRPIT